MKFQRLLAASLLSLPASSLAASSIATATLQVSAAVEQACTISATPLSFGTYDPKAITDTNNSTTLSVTCTKSTPYSINLDYGANGGAGVRSMKTTSGTDRLYYNLYTSEARSQTWYTVKNNTGTSAEQSITVYGQIAKNQWVPAGNYSDTVSITLSIDNVQ